MYFLLFCVCSCMREELIEEVKFVPIIIYNQEAQEDNEDNKEYFVKMFGEEKIYADILGKKNLKFFCLNKKKHEKNHNIEYFYQSDINNNFLNITLQNSINDNPKWIDQILFKNDECRILQVYKYCSENGASIRIDISSEIIFYKYLFWCLKCSSIKEESKIEFLAQYNSDDHFYFYDNKGQISYIPNVNENISMLIHEHYPFFEENKEMATINLE